MYREQKAIIITYCRGWPFAPKTLVFGDPILCAVPQVVLTNVGKEIEKSIQYINNNLNNVSIDKFIIMPNHVHMIIIISSGGDGTPPLQNVIRRFKTYTTKKFNEIFRTVNETLWQRSYYDHIIRDEKEYLEIWEYIDTNPYKWQEDDYYQEVLTDKDK